MRGKDGMSTSWAASALQWWEEAGVDTIVGEAPHEWLTTKAAAPAMPAAAAPEALPATLDAFQAWLAATTDLPFAAASATRAAPAGDPASGLMILVDMPSPDGALVAGEAGALLDRMLGAIGRGRDSIYLAPLSPARSPTGTIDAGAAQRLAEIARHHIGLVAPRALLLFGDLCGKALLGTPVAGGRGRWHALATQAGPIRTLITIRPEKLVGSPDLKKWVWADLQMLREELAP